MEQCSSWESQCKAVLALVEHLEDVAEDLGRSMVDGVEVLAMGVEWAVRVGGGRWCRECERGCGIGAGVQWMACSVSPC